MSKQDIIARMVQRQKATDSAAGMAKQQEKIEARQALKNAIVTAAFPAAQIKNNMAKVEAGKAAGVKIPLDQTSLPASVKADIAQKEYEDYKGSDETRMRQQDINRRALDEAAKKIFAVPGASASDMPLSRQDIPDSQDSKEAELKAKADYFRNQAKLEADRKVIAQNLEEFEGWSEEDKNNLYRYLSDRNAHDAKIFGEPGLDTYNLNPIIGKYGEAKVRRMAEAVERNQNEQVTRQVAQGAMQRVRENPVASGVVESAATVPANLMGSIAGTVEWINELKHRTGQFNTLDPNNIGGIFGAYSGAVREQTAKNIQGDGQSFLRNLVAVGYQGGMSVLDGIARIAAAGGSTGISAAIAASGSFGSGLQKYSAQGATPGQAAGMAFVDAGLEFMTEKLSDSQMLDFYKGGGKPDTVKRFLWQTFGVEPLSEEVNLFAGIAAEAAILGDKSSRNQKIGEMVAGGMSYEQASKEYWKQIMKEAAQTYLVSAAAAGIGRAGAAIVGNRVRSAREQRQGNTAPAVNEAQPARQAVEDAAAALQEKAPAPAPSAPMTDTQQNLRQATEEVTEKGTEGNSEEHRIKEQMRQKQDVINSMDPVADIQTPADFEKLTKTERKEWVIKKLQSTGYKVDRKGFGIIHFAEKRLKNAFKYLKKGSVEQAAFEAMPYVLEHGKEIGEHTDHKSREYGTVTFAAPVIIDGKRGNMAVVVTKTTDNFYKVHRILAPDGTVFKFEGKTNEAEPSLAGESPETGSLATPISSASGFILPESGVEVNTNSEENNPAQMNTESGSVNTSASRTQTEGSKTMPDDGGRIAGTGAAEANFTGRAQYQEMLSDKNSQPERATDVRPMEVLRTDPYGRRVSDTASNLYGAEVTPEHMADEIQSLIQDGALGFDTRSNQESLRNAAEEIAKRGTSATERTITKAVMDGKVRDGDIEKAMLLYARYAAGKSQSSQDRAAELAVDLATMANMTGRNLQMFRLLRRMTPYGQYQAVKQNVNRYVDSINEGRRKGKQVDNTIPKELEHALLTATSDEARQVAQDEIYKYTAAQIKPTLGEMWDAWRNLSMLGNPKTHLRNAAGSLAFRPYANVKRAVGTALERMFVDQQNRTKALVGIGKRDRALLSWAKTDGKSDTVQELMDYSGTTGNNARNAIEENRQILPGVLDKARKANLATMEGTDMLFKQREYALSMAGFLKARGYTIEQVQSGQVPEGVLNEGRRIAVHEAMKATFNDRNKFSDAMANFRVKGSSPTTKALNAMAKGIMPFTRTPANVLVRATEYSAAGVAQSLDTIVRKTRNGEATMAEGLDQLAAGLTGVGASMLGAALAAGIIPGFRLVGKLSEEEKEAGAKEYSVQVGDDYYDIAWLAPGNMPLFIGANMYQSWQDKENSGEDIDAWDVVSGLLETVSDVLDPMLEMSMMSSLNDAIDNMSYQEDMGDKIISLVINSATSYLTQGLPTLFGQLEQATEKTKSVTFANADNPLEQTFQRTMGNATQRIPGIDLYQKDRVDAEGNVMENEGDWMQRAVRALVNPVNKYTEATGPVWDEKQRLNVVLPDSVSSPDIPKKISYTDTSGTVHTGHLLTAEEYSTMEKVQRQTENAVLKTALESLVYAAMTDKQKNQVFTLAQEYAREKARSEAISGYEAPSGWMTGIEGNEADVILQRVAKDSISDAISGYIEGKSGMQQELQNAKQTYDALPADVRNDMLHNAGGMTEYYLKAANAGVSAETFLPLYKQFRDIDEAGGSATERAQKWAYALEEARKAGTITTGQRNVMRENMSYMQMFPAEATKFNELVSQGISTKNADWIANAVRDLKPVNGKSTVSDWQEAQVIAKSGMSERDKITAAKLYLTDAQDKNLDQVTDMGYSVAEYAKLLQIYQSESGAGKKWRTIAKFQEAFPEMNYSEAGTLYGIYG